MNFVSSQPNKAASDPWENRYPPCLPALWFLPLRVVMGVLTIYMWSVIPKTLIDFGSQFCCITTSMWGKCWDHTNMHILKVVLQQNSNVRTIPTAIVSRSSSNYSLTQLQPTHNEGPPKCYLLSLQKHLSFWQQASLSQAQMRPSGIFCLSWSNTGSLFHSH